MDHDSNCKLELEPVQFPVLDRAATTLDWIGLGSSFWTDAGPCAAFWTNYVGYPAE